LWLSLGNLNNSVATAGLSCGNGNNGLSNTNWNIAARHSVSSKFPFIARRAHGAAHLRTSLRRKLVKTGAQTAEHGE
jgi:hypothetical protein